MIVRVDLFDNAFPVLLWTGEIRAFFENADITASICYISEHTLGSLGITRGQFAYLFSLIEVQMSNIVIEYRMSLSNIEFRMSHRFACGQGYF